MKQVKSEQRQKGEKVVQSYESHSLTPHGRLRHDLLFMYYRNFIARHNIAWVFDVGGGSGILVKRLAEEFPRLNAVLIDDDTAMISKARDNLSEYLNSNRVQLIQGSVDDLSSVLKSFTINNKRILVAFNHTIEYVDDQPRVIRLLANTIPKGSFLGIMYLNNSHEAFRKLFYKDSIKGVKKQLKTYQLDMVYFGIARAIDTALLEKILQKNGLVQVIEYGLRCASDFKPSEFVKKNYKDLLGLEFFLGTLNDFIGLARYRLKFFSVSD